MPNEIAIAPSAGTPTTIKQAIEHAEARITSIMAERGLCIAEKIILEEVILDCLAQAFGQLALNCPESEDKITAAFDRLRGDTK